MAPQYVVSSDTENHAESSSPDPLAASFEHDWPRTRRPATRTTPKHAPRSQPLTASSPSKQNRQPNRSSPTKQMSLSTPRTAGHSPWRIKVTVHAEPGSDSDSGGSPLAQHFTHTKTTTIPLKDPDAPPPAKRRGRPRKSDPPTRRSGTPVRKRAASGSRRASVEDTSSASAGAEGTPKKRRGRPPKVPPPAEDDIWNQARRSSVGADASAADVDTDATPKKRRGRPRKSNQPLAPEPHEPVLRVEHPTLQSSSAADHTATVRGPITEDGTQPVIDHASPQEQMTRLKSTPSQTDLSRKLKARKNTPVAKGKDLIPISSDEESDNEGSGAGSRGRWSEERHQHQAEEDDGRLHEFEPAEIPETEDGQHETIDFAFDEGATRMPDDSTIIDSENFSMISVDSLPSCASVTRPMDGARGDNSSSHGHRSPQNHVFLDIPSINSHGTRNPKAGACSSLPTHSQSETLPVAPHRYKTPSVEPVELSQPPPVQVARIIPTEAQTPRIGRVVKAGVALQGVLDPNRITPMSGPSTTLDEYQDHLDDLFRGFSERTRRELHAGLRLGERLAKQDVSNKPSSPALSSPTETAISHLPSASYGATNTTPKESRLLTPEEQDGDTATRVQPTEVQYPILPHNDQDSGLLSPVSNPGGGDEMHWRIDMPPVQLINRASVQPPDLHRSYEVPGRDVPDIWEEEASRSSIAYGSDNACNESASQSQDQLAEDRHVRQARSKLPRTWRRKTSGDPHYIDEAENYEIATLSATESGKSPAQTVNKVQGKVVQSSVLAQSEEDDREEDSEESDDTGMFFQANIPNLFNHKRHSEFRRRRAAQQDVSLNLDESLLPESSPPPAARTRAIDRLNPSIDAPTHFATLLSSPVKSSPLRQELRGSDISSDSAQQTFEESSLPLAPSSPFRTHIENDTDFSMASDQQQLLREMTQSDSSLHRIRDEADEYLDAYEPQERALHDLTEVTEPSRSWHKDNALLAPSSPKQVHHSLEPTSNKPLDKAKTLVASRFEDEECKQPRIDGSTTRVPTRTPTMRTRSPPAHPVLSKLSSLPSVEPWTKTHYKALDKLYQLYKRQPSIFSTTEAPNSDLNTTLLTRFLYVTKRDFIGARYRAWGYNVVFTEALIVLCAAFMQLLTLDTMEEYEAKTGKQIQVGDCQPGVIGDSIGAEGVVERLATVILGEAVRRDEKRGKVVKKSGRLRRD